MLLEKRRKRARGAMGVFTAVETARVRRVARGAVSGVVSAVVERRGVVSAQRRVAAETPFSSSASPATSLMPPSPSDLTSLGRSARPPHPTNSAASSSSLVPSGARAGDNRVLLSRANRMQALVLDRFRSLDLRRSRRCELLEEILRLKKMMHELQEEVDATTRTVESMERLVHHLQGLSTPSSSTASARTPQTTERTCSRRETLRRMDDALRLQLAQRRGTEHEDTEERSQEEDAATSRG